MASNDEATNANGGDQPSPDEASDTSTVGEAGRTEPSDPAPEHQEASPQPQPQPEPEVPAEAPAEASAEARPASQPPPYVPPTAQEPQVQAGGQAQPGAPAWSDLSPAGDDQSGAAPQSWDQQATQQWQQPTAPPPSGPQAPPAGSWPCLLYTSDAAAERSRVDLGGRRITHKQTNRSSEQHPPALTQSA